MYKLFFIICKMNKLYTLKFKNMSIQKQNLMFLDYKKYNPAQ